MVVVCGGWVRQVTRSLCKELNERFLCPMESTAMAITVTEERQVGSRHTTRGSKAHPLTHSRADSWLAFPCWLLLLYRWSCGARTALSSASRR